MGKLLISCFMFVAAWTAKRVQGLYAGFESLGAAGVTLAALVVYSCKGWKEFGDDLKNVIYTVWTFIAGGVAAVQRRHIRAANQAPRLVADQLPHPLANQVSRLSFTLQQYTSRKPWIQC